MSDIHSSCKKRTAYAWAKYYEEIQRQVIQYVVIKEVVKDVDRDNLPAHITKEFVKMADELKKKFTCPICLEDVGPDTVKITYCGHIYHDECLKAVKETREPKCAICRKKL